MQPTNSVLQTSLIVAALWRYRFDAGGGAMRRIILIALRVALVASGSIAPAVKREAEEDWGR
jgi:hypothetical protein